ncbi:MAG TPA: response regulator [Candidatus Binatia bacterium]|nr:response regulator [Candidatus Binatia bacterium]
MTAHVGSILVVEDDEMLRETLGEVLADEGHEVRGAAHGYEALECLDERGVDLIVLDLMMPRMDAFEFREHQRRRPDAATTRLIVLSAARDIETAAERLEADGWLAKPFSLIDVIELVSDLLPERA